MTKAASEISMRSMNRLSAALIIAASLFPSPAYAFVREKAQGSGKGLYWPEVPVHFRINAACAGADTGKGACIEAVKSSFEEWSTPDCTFLTFAYDGDTSNKAVGYDPSSGAVNDNLIIWQFYDWAYESSGIALTTTTYKVETGEIVDADMELNGRDFRFAILDKTDPMFTDIANTVTHEAGHFVGLDHASDPHTTMYPAAPYGEISKRQLAQDDIDGICEIYPGTKDAGGGEFQDCSCASVDTGDPGMPVSLIAALAPLALSLAVRFYWRKRRPSG